MSKPSNRLVVQCVITKHLPDGSQVSQTDWLEWPGVAVGRTVVCYLHHRGESGWVVSEVFYRSRREPRKDFMVALSCVRMESL